MPRACEHASGRERRTGVGVVRSGGSPPPAPHTSLGLFWWRQEVGRCCIDLSCHAIHPSFVAVDAGETTMQQPLWWEGPPPPPPPSILLPPHPCSNSNNAGEGPSQGVLFHPCFHLHTQQQQLFSSIGDPSRPFSCSSTLVSLMEMHQLEIDNYLHQQEQRLRAALHQQRKKHVLALLRGAQVKASALLKQKERELLEARRRSTELEGCARRAEEESCMWQRVAAEQEAVVVELRRKLEEVAKKESGVGTREKEEDSLGSSCGSSGRCGKCMGCGYRDACVVFLPCRHLCSCEICHVLLSLCPVCSSVKQSSVEVFMA